jgi:hypothetical protein
VSITAQSSPGKLPPEDFALVLVSHNPILRIESSYLQVEESSIASALNIQGSVQMSGGKAQQVLDTWQKAVKIYSPNALFDAHGIPRCREALNSQNLG